MLQPGLPGSQVKGEDWLVRKVQELERQLNELRSANMFAPAGIKVRTNEVEFEGAVITGGSLDVNGPATVDGSMTINGPAVITGTLSLPAGIIDNDALAAPLEVAYASAAETNFGTALTDQNRAVTTIAVPAGYTRALVMCFCAAGVINSEPNPDFLYLSASINGVKSRELYSEAPGGKASPPITTAKSTTLTGLSGGNITLAAAIHSQSAAWAANPISRAYVEAQAIFLR